jgi:hypothetical protein
MNDKNIVMFHARGVIYNRDKQGNPIKGSTKRVLHGRGVAKEGQDLDGTIFRQCTYLLPCDAMTVRTYTI